MSSDLGAYFVSINVLDNNVPPVKMFKQEMPIPIANGYVIIGKGEENLSFSAKNFEFVTIFTVNEIIDGVEQATIAQKEVYEIVNGIDKYRIK